MAPAINGFTSLATFLVYSNSCSFFSNRLEMTTVRSFLNPRIYWLSIVNSLTDSLVVSLIFRPAFFLWYSIRASMAMHPFNHREIPLQAAGAPACQERCTFQTEWSNQKTRPHAPRWSSQTPLRFRPAQISSGWSGDRHRYAGISAPGLIAVYFGADSSPCCPQFSSIICKGLQWPPAAADRWPNWSKSHSL